MKDKSYFGWGRPDILAVVPTTATRVLDIGCAAGYLGESLKRRQSCEVWGVEYNRAAAELASQRLDRVILADVEDDLLEMPEKAFDVIVCGDVLEHLRKPQLLLKRCQRWLTPGGSLIASIPNAQHHSVLTGLLNGNFTYQRAGLLDEDHLRLFTRREIEKLFFNTGYRIVELRSNPGAGWDEWIQSGRLSDISIGGLAITGIPPEQAGDFFAYQFLVQARPEPIVEYGLTSIVLITHNQITYTRQCVDSLRLMTNEPFELIVVDNGSTDGTCEYFLAQTDVKLISNPDNRGFPTAVNQGLRVASGDQFVLLNNDTIVTTGWLRRLLDALNRDPDIGLVGPVSNSVSGVQQIPVSYRDLASLDGFAWERSKSHAGEVTDAKRLVGFCLLIRREVVQQIGEFDERFGLGNFEDDDYCRRAINAKFRVVIAWDSFVHHFGGQTFRGMGVDFPRLLERNRAIYEEKWSSSVAVAEVPTVSSVSGKQPPRLSLCMIVRDNEAIIGRCLASIAPFVDEMVVVDTGSMDRTAAICADYGAKVWHFPWCDDFSAARNESLRYATGDWIFWMDSDDVMPLEQGRRLRQLVDADHSLNCYGYIFQVHCLSDDLGQHTSVDHVKLFRNHLGLAFEHRIHEQILPAIRRAGGDVAFTSINVVHEGSRQSPDVRRSKLERDFRILELDLAERPDHPFVLFNLGMTCEDCGRHEEAELYLRRSLSCSGPSESHVRKAWALLIGSLRSQGRTTDAMAAAHDALTLFPFDHELRFRRAVILQTIGRHKEAVEDYRCILSQSPELVFRSVDPSISGFKAHCNLAASLEQLGHKQEALKQRRCALRIRPESPESHLAVAELLIDLGRLAELEAMLSELPPELKHSPCASEIKSLIMEERGAIEDAAMELTAAWNRWESVRCLDAFARIMVESGQAARALPALEKLLHIRPDDPATLHNCGSALVALGRREEAVPLLRRSLELRPLSTLTEELLAVASRPNPTDWKSEFGTIDK